MISRCSKIINKKIPSANESIGTKGGELMNYSYLYDGEIVDTGYGFTNNKVIEVCSEEELDDM